jgi:hypothetical protein
MEVERMIENIIKSLQYIEDNLTLKKDYSAELEQLQNLKDSIKTLSSHQWNTPKWKIAQANKKADSIINWMQEEMKRA